MKILTVHNRYRSAAPSGENRVVDQESAALGERGYTVELFERHSDDIDGWSWQAKLALPGRVIWNPAAKRDLAAVLRRFAPDVVHVHNTFPLLSASVLHACRDARIPVVATLHNYKLLCASGDFFRDGKVCHDCASGAAAPALIHRCYRGSAAATLPPVIGTRLNRSSWQTLVSAYIFISDSLRQSLHLLGFDPERSFVKHNLVPQDPFQELRTRSRDSRQVAYVGRLDAAKGVPLLLAAWDRYRAEAGDDALQLAIAGSGELGDEVRRWAAGRDSVHLAGHLSKRECTELIGRSRAVVLPSQWEETFGLVVVEAMAAGVPSIASDHGSFPELITGGVDGALFRPGDPEDLARVLTAVDADPEQFESFGRNARTTYEKQHDPERNIDQLLDIYRFAIRRPVYG